MFLSRVGERPRDSGVSSGRHLLDIDDLDRDEILALLDRAEHFRRERPRPPLPLEGRVVGLFFFQPSTRTRLGFHAAAARVGATAIELTTTKYEAGMSAPESPLDSFRSIAGYCDLIVLRHSDESDFQEMVSHSPVPVINGGCGTSSHPTQTLVDLFAIRSHFGRIEGLRIGLAGDLAGSRAAKSLVKALRHFPPAELRLMAPEGHQMDGPSGFLATVAASRLDADGLDVLDMVGFPEGNRTAQGIRRHCQLDSSMADKLGAGALIISPLPRIDEITTAVDSMPQAAYFTQHSSGQCVRMAILTLSNRRRLC